MIINALTGTSNADNIFLHSGAWDKFIKRWKIENGTCDLVDACNVDAVVNVMTNGDNGTIYVGCGDGRVLRVDN